MALVLIAMLGSVASCPAATDHISYMHAGMPPRGCYAIVSESDEVIGQD